MNTLFDIPAQHPNTFCRTCIHAQLTAFAHSNKKFYYCTARKSNRTTIGLLKIKLKNWITGFVKVEGQPTDPRAVGKVNQFIASTNFPVSSNDSGTAVEIFDSLDEAKKYIEELFLNFKKHINK